MSVDGYQTPLRVGEGEDWPLSGRPWLRRVGWLDQKGRVYVEMPPGEDFDGGSLTPLLVAVESD